MSAAIGAAATILVLSTGAVAAADPDSSTARANGAADANATLGIRSDHAAPSRPQLDHGGGLQLPATDVESAPLGVDAPASGVGLGLATWILVFVGGVLASLRYMKQRPRL
jgi:hypothetical protein